MKLPELLAPAGDMKAFRAAVLNGADAVYLGGEKFSARAFAANFDMEEIKEAVVFAHLRGVKVFITVNTLIKEDEKESLLAYVQKLNSLAVDGIIVQDWGAYLALRKTFPQLRIHASTQMTIHNSQGVLFAEKMGLQRVVLARETSLEEIKKIKKVARIELEIFSHGALCVSYSGQCYFSSMVGGRSGNRGQCAQPCRLSYQLKQGNKGLTKGYLLSPKDLNTLEYLPEIVEAGVDSIKIEGRMKRPEYVAVVVRAYRKALDRLQANDFYVRTEEKEAVEQIFNRGFTNAYLTGSDRTDLMNFKKPNNRGIFLGRLKEVDFEQQKGRIKINTSLGIKDSLEFWQTKGGRKGLEVNWIQNQTGSNIDRAAVGEILWIPVTSNAQVGDRVFKTNDAALLADIQKSFLEPIKIPLHCQVKLRENEALWVAYEDDRGNRVEGYSQGKAEKAVKTPLDEKLLRKQLGRLGNTDYVLQEITVDLTEGLLIPISQLNQLRRSLVEKITQKRLADFAGNLKKPDLKPVFDTKKNMVRYRKKDDQKLRLAVKVASFDTLKVALQEKVSLIYLDIDELYKKNGQEEIGKILGESYLGLKIVPVLPRIIAERELTAVKEAILEFQAKNIYQGIMVSNPGHLNLLQEIKWEKEIYGDYFLNIINSNSVEFWQQQAIDQCCLSPELNFEQIAQVRTGARGNMECLVQGYLPLMITRYCAPGVLTKQDPSLDLCGKNCQTQDLCLEDDKGYVFPIKSRWGCYMEVFNSRELCLLENLVRFQELGCQWIRVEGSLYDGRELQRLISQYKKALTILALPKEETKDRLLMIAEEVKKQSKTGVTKGHYFRGIS